MASGAALVYANLSFPIHRLCTTIGRRNTSAGIVPAIDLTPFDHERVVSRRHAEIAYRDGALFLIDLEARNGVFVNGERMASAAERLLRDGDVLSFGGVFFTFRALRPWPEGLRPEWDVAAADPLGFDSPTSDVTSLSAETVAGPLLRSIEHQQLFLAFQPKVRLADHELQAAECLLRWRHPDRGVVYPDEFLPLAETTGFIKAITAWVLEAALEQCATWRGQGLHIRVAVNLSARDLDDDQLVEKVGSSLQKTAVDPSQLILEITETGVMSNRQRAVEILEAVRATGVQISIDDFGIGHSSLAYLRDLPAQELKIDKSFCMALDAHKLAIVRSAIQVGHDLGMRVTAEGVETEAAAAALRDLGCDLAQGYLFAPPLEREAFWTHPLTVRAVERGAG